MNAGWPGYLSAFHTARSGITEAVLSRSRHDGIDPYDWLAEAVASRGPVLDLASGSAPLWQRLSGRGYLGVDVSAGELALAAGRGAGPLAQASGTALPIRSAAVGVVVCSMALMVLTPLPLALAEIGRVLVPGGRLVATVPDTHPLRVRDMPVAVGLLAGLGRRLGYPNDSQLRRLPQLLAEAGLRLINDEGRRFSYLLNSPAAADMFLASLYLPDLPPARHRLARGWLRAVAQVQAEMPVPIRRLVAERE